MRIIPGRATTSLPCMLELALKLAASLGISIDDLKSISFMMKSAVPIVLFKGKDRVIGRYQMRGNRDRGDSSTRS